MLSSMLLVALASSLAGSQVLAIAWQEGSV